MMNLSTLLSLPVFPPAADVAQAIDAEPLGHFNPAYDSLGILLAGMDEVVGEAFQSQVAMARRLARLGSPPELQTARNSLSRIVLGMGLKWDEAPIKKPRPTQIVQRGSFWKLLEYWKDPSPADRNIKKDSVETIKPAAGLQNSAIAMAQGGRDSQQDRALAFEGILPDGRAVAVSIVADGCFITGGVASETAVQSFIQKLFEELVFNPLYVLDAILLALRFADRQTAEKAGDLGGTMFVAYVQVGDEKYIVNVGDSHAWFLSDTGEYTKVTIDHRLWDFVNYAPLRRLGWREPLDKEGVVSLGEPDIFIPTQELSGLLFLFSDGVWGETGEMVARAFPNKPLDLLARDIINVMPQEFDNMTVNIRRIGQGKS